MLIFRKSQPRLTGPILRTANSDRTTTESEEDDTQAYEVEGDRSTDLMTNGVFKSTDNMIGKAKRASIVTSESWLALSVDCNTDLEYEISWYMFEKKSGKMVEISKNSGKCQKGKNFVKKIKSSLLRKSKNSQVMVSIKLMTGDMMHVRRI